MESKRRNTWVFVVMFLVIACCCALVAAAAAIGWFADWSFDWWAVPGSESERIEETFEVGRTPNLEIDSFAGSIAVRAGDGDTIQVIATKRARSKSTLDRIELEMSERDGGLRIKAQKPSTLINASVQFEIVVPAGTQLDAHTGSGSVDVYGLDGDVEVDTGSGSVDLSNLGGDAKVETGSGSVSLEDVAGEIDAHTGSGSMDVRGASDRVRLDTGSGRIEYEGNPSGDCRFHTGSGSITLVLPGELNVDVDLDTGSGEIDVEFVVEGHTARGEVKGTIGDGSQGSIYAHTGSGDIDVIRR